MSVVKSPGVPCSPKSIWEIALYIRNVEGKQFDMDAIATFFFSSFSKFVQLKGGRENKTNANKIGTNDAEIIRERSLTCFLDWRGGTELQLYITNIKHTHTQKCRQRITRIYHFLKHKETSYLFSFKRIHRETLTSRCNKSTLAPAQFTNYIFISL